MQRLCITSEERWAELELLGAMAASARGVAILLPRVRGVVCQRQRADAEPGEFIWMVEMDCALPLCDVVVARGCWTAAEGTGPTSDGTPGFPRSHDWDLIRLYRARWAYRPVYVRGRDTQVTL